MKKAIITGGNGFIGSAVVNELLKNNIEVLALGRKDLSEPKLKINQLSKLFKYVKIDMANIRSLPQAISEQKWETGNSCVFYNFAWVGSKRLADGQIEEQIKNITYSANAVITAREVGCKKFINCGSMEETFAEQYLKNEWKSKAYHSSQANYAVSKLASRDLSILTAYLQKINYVHTRLSVPLDSQLSSKGYIPNVLENILNGRPYNEPLNKQLFDIISLNDVAKAYYLIGLKGRNKANYFIGSSQPKTLNQYFTAFKNVVKSLENKNKTSNSNPSPISNRAFDTEELFNDTGFEVNDTFDEFAKKIKKQWKKR